MNNTVIKLIALCVIIFWQFGQINAIAGTESIEFLYGQYKTFIKLGQRAKAEQMLRTLERRRIPGMKQVVTFERVKMLDKSGDTRGLIEEIKKNPEMFDNELMSKLVLRHIKGNLDKISDKKYIVVALEKIFTVSTQFRRDTDLIKVNLELLDMTDPRREELLLKLWVYSNIKDLNEKWKRHLKFIKKNINDYPDIIQKHFKNITFKI